MSKLIVLQFEDFIQYPNLEQIVWGDEQHQQPLSPADSRKMFCIPEKHPSWILLAIMFPHKVVEFSHHQQSIWSPHNLVLNKLPRNEHCEKHHTTIL